MRTAHGRCAVRAVGSVADGVIVGSALIDVIGQAAEPARAAGNFVCELRKGMAAVE